MQYNTLLLRWFRKPNGSQAASRLLPWRLGERPEARPSFWLPVHLRVAAPRLGQVGSGRRLGEFWEAALGRGDKREESLSRLVLQLRPFNYLSICQALGGPGRGAASGTGRGVRRELGGRKAARAGSECCECVCGACCLGEQVQRQRAQGCVGERNCPGAANPAVGHGALAGAAQQRCRLEVWWPAGRGGVFGPCGQGGGVQGCPEAMEEGAGRGLQYGRCAALAWGGCRMVGGLWG